MSTSGIHTAQQAMAVESIVETLIDKADSTSTFAIRRGYLQVVSAVLDHALLTARPPSPPMISERHS